MDLLYHTFTEKAMAGGNVQVKLNHPAVAVHRKGSAASKAAANHASSSSSGSRAAGPEPAVVVDSQGQAHAFDAVIMACHAPAALQLLQQPTWVHKAALGGVEYHQQSTVMHTDEEYIRR
jgi:predicted NAD/FAD-binding protein